MQQPLPQFGGLFLHCVLRTMGNAFISHLALTGIHRRREWCFSFKTQQCKLWLLQKRKIYVALQRLWVNHQQSILLLSPPALPWSAWRSVAPPKEVTKDHESSVVLSAVFCTMYIWCIPPLGSQPLLLKKICLASRRLCHHYGH